jgi:hypothetical protein
MEKLFDHSVVVVVEVEEDDDVESFLSVRILHVHNMIMKTYKDCKFYLLTINRNNR